MNKVVSGELVRLVAGLVILSILGLGIWWEARRELARAGFGSPGPRHQIRKTLEMARAGQLPDGADQELVELALARGWITQEEVCEAIDEGKLVRERQMTAALTGGFPPELIRGRPEFAAVFREATIRADVRSRRRQEAERALEAIAAGHGSEADSRAVKTGLREGLVTVERVKTAVRAGERAGARDLLRQLHRELLPVTKEEGLEDLLARAGCEPVEADGYRRLWEDRMSRYAVESLLHLIKVNNWEQHVRRGLQRGLFDRAYVLSHYESACSLEDEKGYWLPLDGLTMELLEDELRQRPDSYAMSAGAEGRTSVP